MKKKLSLVSFAFLISACSLLPHPEEPTKKYVLGILSNAPELSQASNAAQIIVDLPSVYPPIDNTRIALKPQISTIDYYADVEWADRLNGLIQESLIYSLQNTGKFRGISRPAEGIQSDYALKLEVRKFYIDHPNNPQMRVAQVDYMVHLVKLPMRHIVCSHNFAHSQSVPESTIDNIIKSLNDAHLQAIRALIPWLLGCLSSHRHTAPAP
jgi:cholesterol transport system auxiliary component